MAKAGSILLAAGVMSVASAAAAVAQHRTLHVYLRNDAHVAGDTLDEARRIVSEIYSEAGVTLLWCSDDCTVTIALRPRASDDTARRANDAMGYTPGGGEERGRLAFVLINRVNEIAGGYSTARSVVLGAAIAHELGHLLISKEHSETGIMKAYLNQSDFRKARRGELRLTAEQAGQLRSSMSAPPAQSEDITELHRVRSRHAVLQMLIARAEVESPTFHRMVQAINASDGIVYIDPGTCRGVRACLVHVASEGGYRFLFVKVNTARADHAVMASIGHELRHAIEVLSNPKVTDAATLYLFYKLNDDHFGSAASFETLAAIEAGDAVADEIRRFRRAARR